MSSTARNFGPFRLDIENRRLSRGSETIELPARYLDVLILLVSAEGALVTKDRFMDEVWRGVPVTDEALTQAIRTLRKALGDSASAPRFIETAPKHGYRFIAPPDLPVRSTREVACGATLSRLGFIHQTSAGIGGALLAGSLVGLLYGFAGAAQAGGGGAISLLLVIILVSAVSAGASGAGIAAGITLSGAIKSPGWHWRAAGGAIGGVSLGAIANMIGRDAFRLLLGQEIGPFAGAMEGFLIRAVAGLAFFLMERRVRYATAMTALLGAMTGLIVIALGGRMMAGSLQTVVTAFPSSEFRLDAFGNLLGERGFGPTSRLLTAAFEGSVFVLSLTWAMHKVCGRETTDRSDLD